MQQTPLPTDSLPASATARHGGRFIYIACPWTPVGGGMFKVCEYLMQSQAAHPPATAAQLRPLDSRGGASAVFSLFVLLTALAKILWGRVQGRLAGVHVNMGPRLSLFRKGTIVVTCRALGIPVVVHLHCQMSGFYDTLPDSLRRLTRWVFALADTVVVIGPAARRFVTEELQVPADRVEIVINGVPAAAEPRRKAEPGGVQRVLFLGNLSDQKGVTDLLLALARPGFDRQRLEVTIGGGGDVAGYQAKARELGIADFVRLPGWCDQPDTARLLARADVLVLPSYDEVLPLVILEALANGVAVVCTPLGEIPSLLTDGVDILYVTPGDIDGIAATLQTLLRQPDLREALEHNGRALYERQFSLSRFFAAMARIHQRTFGVAGQPSSADGAAPGRAP
jgi:glycosyltransferase involved in cell wall biosynthesis